MLRVVIEYIMVDGHFTKVYGYHFVLLNHFWYKVRVYFPFYLLISLKHCILEHCENPRSFLVLHVGLIHLIYEHFANMPAQSNHIYPSYFGDHDMESSEPKGNLSEDFDREEEITPPLRKASKTSLLSRPSGKLVSSIKSQPKSNKKVKPHKKKKIGFIL